MLEIRPDTCSSRLLPAVLVAVCARQIHSPSSPSWCTGCTDVHAAEELPADRSTQYDLADRSQRERLAGLVLDYLCEIVAPRTPSARRIHIALVRLWCRSPLSCSYRNRLVLHWFHPWQKCRKMHGDWNWSIIMVWPLHCISYSL